MFKMLKWLLVIAVVLGVVGWFWLERQGAEGRQRDVPRAPVGEGEYKQKPAPALDDHSSEDRQALENLIRNRLGGESGK